MGHGSAILAGSIQDSGPGYCSTSLVHHPLDKKGGIVSTIRCLGFWWKGDGGRIDRSRAIYIVVGKQKGEGRRGNRGRVF